MSHSIPDVVKQVMADILEVDPSAIRDDAGMDQIGTWDSHNHINLVMALEEEFGVSFDVAEIEQMLTLSDIVSTVERKT